MLSEFKSLSFTKFLVEVKKEPELPAEAAKQEEREVAIKPPTAAGATKPPPEKRARLQ